MNARERDELMIRMDERVKTVFMATIIGGLIAAMRYI